MRRTTIGIVLAAAILLSVAACDGRGDDPRPAPPPGVAADTAWAECRSGYGFFVVAYPPDWRTNDDAVLPPCTLFDPAPIDVPEASEIPPDIAVVISVQDVEWAAMAGSTFAIREISREDMEVAGRRAVRRLVEHTGEGLWEAGMRTWWYVVDWADGRTLFAESNDVGEPDFATKRAVLDGMMARLQRQ